MQETTQKKFYQEIGSRIRDARIINNITQQVLADQLGLTRASIINIEMGRHKPSLHLLLEIAEVLQLDYTALIPVQASQLVKQKKSLDLSKIVTDQKMSRTTEATLRDIIASFHH